MYKNLVKSIFLLFIVLFSIQARADIEVLDTSEQATYTNTTNSDYFIAQQGLGTGISGSVTGVEVPFYVHSSDSDTMKVDVYVEEFTSQTEYLKNYGLSADCSGTTSNVWYAFGSSSAVVENSVNLFVWDGTSGILDGQSWNASRYYGIIIVYSFTGSPTPTTDSASLMGSATQYFDVPVVQKSATSNPGCNEPHYDLGDVQTVAFTLEGIGDLYVPPLFEQTCGVGIQVCIHSYQPEANSFVSSTTPFALEYWVYIDPEIWEDDTFYVRVKHRVAEWRELSVSDPIFTYVNRPEIELDSGDNLYIQGFYCYPDAGSDPFATDADFETWEDCPESWLGVQDVVIEVVRKSFVNNIIGWFGTFGTMIDSLLPNQRIQNRVVYQFVIEDLSTYDNWVGTLDVIGEDTYNFITNATSTAGVRDTCSMNAGFNFLDCLSSLFIPSSTQLADLWLGFSDAFLKRFPFGYLTHFFAVLTSDDLEPEAFPLISITMNENSPLEGEFGFDFNEILAEADSIIREQNLSADGIIEVDGSKNFWQIIMPVINTFAYMILFLIFLSNITKLPFRP